jgi:hypothetical protein
MPARRILTAAAMLLCGTFTLLADDPKPAPKPDPKPAAKPDVPAEVKAARRLARMKAAEEAKAKADAEARAKADAESKAKESEKPKVEPKPLKTNTAALTKRIDDEIAKKLASEKLTASPRADDAEFIRRVYLDLTGVVPPAAKVAGFLDNKAPDKREKLIDELLTSPAFGHHLADIWDRLLIHRMTDNRAIKVDPLNAWLEEKFTEGAGWNEIVTGLLTATGTQEENGASTFVMAQLTADKMVDSTSKLFMGIKMECTQCHNHPFTGWKQNEYWGMAAFFMKVRVQGNTKNANRGAAPGVIEAVNNQGKQKGLPESAKTLPPKFFKGEEPKVGRGDPLRPVLAKWLTSPDNKFFSRAFANRVWGQLFGSGIVNPIDDMHDERVPSHPELLAELSKQFAANGFDVRYLYRAVCNSAAYQRTSKPVAGNERDTVLFSHMNIKVLTPEQLYDSLTAVLGEPGRAGGMGKGAANGKGGPQTPRTQFVNFFDPGETAKATDYENGIPQALRLMNHPYTARTSLPVARELAKGESKEKAIEKLYLATLSRRPTVAETAKLTGYVGGHSADSYGDILWALLNSSEFGLNH